MMKIKVIMVSSTETNIKGLKINKEDIKNVSNEAKIEDNATDIILWYLNIGSTATSWEHVLPEKEMLYIISLNL